MYDIILKNCIKYLQISKKKNGVPTLVGGFHPTLDPAVIDENDSIDMIVRGEGEIALKEILSGKPKNEILGLSYRENGKVYHNPERPFVKNLDDLPLPRNELVDNSPYHYLWMRAWVCESSRGCPFTCDFCCVTKFYKGGYRTKSPERVIQELMLVPPKTKVVFFVDDNLTLNKKRVIRICELIQKTNLNKRLMFVCQSRVDDIANNPEMVEEMHKSGFILIFFGFESLKQMALDRMNKGYSLDKALKCVKLCHDNGILVFGSFIIGNIGETKEDTRRTFKLMKDIEVDFIMTMPITPFPGTKLHDEAVEKGWVEKDLKWEQIKSSNKKPIMCTPDLTRDEISELLSESYRTFYLDRKFHFRKYLSLDHGPIRSNPNFRWTWRYFLKFFTKGITKFMMQIDKIVDDVYDVSEEVKETELSIDH